ncbi:MAG: hypothetical protein H6Q19_946 [Bacteroidetes bacterium]|nr:hypothetical protein [Bacteroidota bacterium]
MKRLTEEISLSINPQKNTSGLFIPLIGALNKFCFYLQL